ncbi:hypothetical protein X777_03274 [Ooceraea biroi]|uniref:Uncharacterized protein n=1 Tax=Ooceraea biroi TaxID=2015173 RepID=A0A026WLT7_OOCBI|nr:hypothetical protein X777_03274 [Ooceraea biroi]
MHTHRKMHRAGSQVDVTSNLVYPHTAKVPIFPPAERSAPPCINRNVYEITVPIRRLTFAPVTRLTLP